MPHQDIFSTQTASQIKNEIKGARDLSHLNEIRIKAFGKKSALALALKSLGALDEKKRKAQAIYLNKIKYELTDLLKARKTFLEAQQLSARLEKESADESLPVLDEVFMTGFLHPVSVAQKELIDIFVRLGFKVKEGPDIETEYYNFTALNMPPHHPARHMHDTFYFPTQKLKSKHQHISVEESHLPTQEESSTQTKPTSFLLRTHTSPVQIRVMEKGKPPYAFITIGRAYRCDSDQTHTPMFHQLEAVLIDKHIHMGHLKYVLETFLKSFFELDELSLRLRPSYFPFTEPSMEVDIQCSKTSGRLDIGKGDDWMEILGCGMVHPDILERLGLKDGNYQGFAFGLGIDRLAMLKYGIADLRQCFNNDMRWLKHYGLSVLRGIR